MMDFDLNTIVAEFSHDPALSVVKPRSAESESAPFEWREIASSTEATARVDEDDIGGERLSGSAVNELMSERFEA